MADQSSFSLKRLLATTVVLILIACGVLLYFRNMKSSEKERLEQTVFKRIGFGQPASTVLHKRYTDADGDLVADAPADPEKHLSPERLVFSYVATSDQEKQKTAWAEFVERLSEATGKEVEHIHYESADVQIDALRNGELHVTGFNTGSVPKAVCTAGFVPVSTFGEEDDSFGYKMKIIVPAKSETKSVSELRGTKVTFTSLASNSGCKAALVLLANEHQMHPDRDYEWGVSGSHQRSIEGIAKGELDAAAVASNLLDQAVADGVIETGAFREIYESEKFPPAALGYHHALAPELTEKIRACLEDFDFSGTGLQELHAAAGETNFVPVTYKEDWAIVRGIDESLAKAGT